MRTRTPRLTLIALLALTAALACLAAPSLASALEAPETLKPELETITASGAVLRGLLSPHAAGELGGTYEFLYNASETGECKGGSSTAPGMALGGEAEPVSEPVEGLNQQTVYAVCLVVHNQAKTEEAVGPVVTFLTGPPETPEDEEAINITATSATLKGMLNPHHAGEPDRYRFRYNQSASQCEGGKAIPQEGVEPPFTSLGHEAEVVEATATGLAPATTYTFCVFTRNEAFEGVVGAPVTFTTPFAPPGVAGESVVKVYSEEVTVSAEISPNGLATSYSVEYEPGKSTPEATLPASTAPVAVRQRITGLRPATVYHYRFVARNSLGVSEGTSETLTTAATAVSAGNESCANSTFAGFSPSLPDCRAYELVSGAAEVGDVYAPGGTSRERSIPTARPFRAATDGGAVAYVADPGAVGGDGSSAPGRGNEYLAVRGPHAGLSGWETANITPPVGSGESASAERQYVAFSPDLALGIVASEAPLLAARPSPQGPAGCAVLYSHDNRLSEGFSALFTETSSPEICGKFEESGTGRSGDDSSLIFAGETPDHSVKLFDSNAALTAPAAPSGGDGGNVYASTAGGKLTVVNILPDGTVEQSAVAGGPSELTGNNPDFDHVISAGGERVIWSSVAPRESLAHNTAAFPTALYARENALSPTAHTVQLDAAVEGAAGPSGGGEFWAASADGDKVFFTDCHKLTPDATADEEGGCSHVTGSGSEDLVKTGSDLFEYQFTSGSGPKLTDITVDHDAGDPLGADVQGVIGASEDGDFVYFVAGGSLGAKANARGESPAAGKCELATSLTDKLEELEGHVPVALGCNLFELHFNGVRWEVPRFIAKLAPSDNIKSFSLNAPGGVGKGLEVVGDWNPTLGSRTAEVTPNGEAMIFSSTQDLTGYDVSRASVASAPGGVGGYEVFLFRARSHSLTCVSCDPRNTPPDIEAILRTPTYLPVSSSDTFMHRWMNTAGTEVFFDSSQPLVPGDSNGLQDVYEWEAEGTPGCPAATSVYGGCVSLLSGGASADGSFLVDADETGENVFITHRGPLGGAGPNDDKVHVYDVHAEGGFAASSLGCTGTGCQGVPPAAPVFATPASFTFSGVGNFPAAPSRVPGAPMTRAQKLARALRVCRGDRARHARTVCEQRARRRYRAMGARSRKRNGKRSGGKS